MPQKVRLILALSPDRACWIATASDGAVVRAKLRTTAFYEQLKQLRAKYGQAVELEQETLYPPEHTIATEELEAAQREEEEASKKLDQLETALVIELLRQSVGGVLRQGLTEIGECLGTSEDRLLTLINLPALTDGLDPSTTKQALVLSPPLQRRIALVQAQRAAVHELRRKRCDKQFALDTVSWKFGLSENRASDLTRDIMLW